MEANELMIGDLFRVNKDVSFKKGTIVVIRGIDADRTFHELNGCATCVALGNPDEMQGGVWLEYLDPIPITPEILEKNGFKVKEPESNFKYVTAGRKYIIEFLFFGEAIHGVSTVMDCEVGFSGGLDRIHKCNVKYVHELQHALKLCGIEKEIELL